MLKLLSAFTFSTLPYEGIHERNGLSQPDVYHPKLVRGWMVGRIRLPQSRHAPCHQQHISNITSTTTWARLWKHTGGIPQHNVHAFTPESEYLFQILFMFAVSLPTQLLSPLALYAYDAVLGIVLATHNCVSENDSKSELPSVATECITDELVHINIIGKTVCICSSHK